MGVYLSAKFEVSSMIPTRFKSPPPPLPSPQIRVNNQNFNSSVLNIFSNWSNFNKEEFILDYFERDWDLILNVEKNDVNHSFDNFLLNMNGLLEKHAP